MIISKAEVRELGFVKIYKIFQREFDLEEIINKVLIELNQVNVPAFSLPNCYSSIEKTSEKVETGGIRLMLASVDPLIAEVDKPSQASKRKFRDNWIKVWSWFSEAIEKHLGIPVDTVLESKFSKIGLILPLYYAGVSEKDAKAVKLLGGESVCNALAQNTELCNNIDKLNHFFNVVELWSVYISDLYMGDLSNLVFYIATMPDTEFVSWLLSLVE